MIASCCGMHRLGSLAPLRFSDQTVKRVHMGYIDAKVSALGDMD